MINLKLKSKRKKEFLSQGMDEEEVNIIVDT